jgi:uncharacterized coiled-coil protein SlyX
LEKDKKDVFYPTFDDLRKEEMDQAAKLVLIITDESGNEIKRLQTKASKGTTKLVWNLRGESTNTINANSKSNNGFLVKPGKYTISCSLLTNGALESLGEKQSFEVKNLNNLSVPASDFSALDKFRKEVAELNKQVSETSSKLGKMESQLNAIENAITIYPGADYKLLTEVRALKQTRSECATKMWGDRIKTAREFEAEPSLSERLNMLEYKLYENRSGVSNTHRRNKEIVAEEHSALKTQIDSMKSKIDALISELKKAGVPYIAE